MWTETLYTSGRVYKRFLTYAEYAEQYTIANTQSDNIIKNIIKWQFQPLAVCGTFHLPPVGPSRSSLL